MTAPNNKPITKEQHDRFVEYRMKYPTWGALKPVLDGFSNKDHHVQSCIEVAQAWGDVEGEALARILLTMSKSQRLKLARERF